MIVTEDSLGKFDVDSIAPEALLFQTGYLTIGRRETRHGKRRYRLVYADDEVRQSLDASLLTYLTGQDPRREQHCDALEDLLVGGDLAGLERQVRASYDSIPCEWHTRNDIAHYERFYASVFYGYVSGLDVAVTVEDSSNRGRLDMAVQAGGYVCLFEFKARQENRDGAALAQLKNRDYAAKWPGDRHLEMPIYLVGVEFNAETRNVEVFNTAVA